MVWAGVFYGQRTQVHFIDGILNAQRYRDEILKPIVVSFIQDHHLMLLHDNARPHVARICTQFLEAENIPVLAWPAYSCHPLSMFGMLWIGIYDSVFQFLPISSNFAQPLKRSGPTFHRPQSTTWSTLCEGDVLHCVRKMVVTPETDWFSDPPKTVKLHILEWPFIVASLRHTCAIIMLSYQHLDITPVRWMDYLGKGEVLTNTDLDTIVNNIWEKWAFCVHRKSLRSLVQLMTNGGKNKSVAFIILVSVIKANVEPFASRADNKRCNKKV